jgi:DNA replication protein DnaC
LVLLAKTRLAHFGFHKTLADFDFSFQPSVERKQIQEGQDLADHDSLPG